MPACCLVLLCLMAPRLLLFIFWVATDYFMAFESSLWPFLGFVFMPFTTLAYMAAILNNGAMEGWWIVLLIFAILTDLGGNSSTASSKKES